MRERATGRPLPPSRVAPRSSRSARAPRKGPKPAGQKAPASLPLRPLEPKMELTPWREEPDGSLTRTLTAVDREGAEART